MPYLSFPFAFTLAPSATAALADRKSPPLHAVASRSASDTEETVLVVEPLAAVPMRCCESGMREHRERWSDREDAINAKFEQDGTTTACGRCDGYAGSTQGPAVMQCGMGFLVTEAGVSAGCERLTAHVYALARNGVMASSARRV